LRLLVVLGSGGHTAQMIRLVEMLPQGFEYIYMIGMDDALSENKITKRGEIHKVHRARRHEDGFFMSAVKVIRLFFESFRLLLKLGPDAVVSAGPGTAVPVSILARLMGKKVIYIEDWSRVYSKSGTGRILYRFANVTFVQWPEMKKIYSRAVYAGRLS